MNRRSLSVLFLASAMWTLVASGANNSDTLLDSIARVLKAHHIEQFQHLSVQKIRAKSIVDVEFDTSTYVRGVCITKVAQFIFSTEETVESFEEQMWLGDCKDTPVENSISIGRGVDRALVAQLMLDARALFESADSRDDQNYFFEDRSLLEYRHRASKVRFVSVGSNGPRIGLGIAIVTQSATRYAEISRTPSDKPHSGRISAWSPNF